MNIQQQLGELKEQGKWIQKKLVDLESKVDEMRRFKWQIIGGSATLSCLCVSVVGFIIEIFRRN